MVVDGLLSVFGNKNIRFIISRYFVYVIQFFNSILIAKYLGPYYLGIWGFILLIIQYLTQINFGIPHALNVKLATSEKGDPALQIAYFGNSLLLMAAHSVFLLILVIISLNTRIAIFDKYKFYDYIYWVFFIAIFQNIALLFVSAFRVKNILGPIVLFQAAMPITTLVVSFILKGEKLLYALLISSMVSYLVPLFVFILNSPVRIKLKFRFNIQKELLQKGLALLLYNASFYFIMIITRTFVSFYYDVKELGYFSFALSLAQASFLILDTISFLIFPKLINRFKDKAGIELFEHVEFVRGNYSLIAYLLIFLSILIFPIILYFLPEYYESYKPFVFLSISMALLSGSFGISTVFISFGKELLLGRIALISLLINFFFVWLLAEVTSISYMLCIGPLVTYFIYCCLLGHFYNSIFRKQKDLKGIFVNFDLKLIIPSLVLLVGMLYNNILVESGAYLLLAILNFQTMKRLQPIIKSIITNPSLFKI